MADSIAMPIDFSRRYGDGLSMGVSLGGGGIWFIAWQVSYLQQLADMGINLAGADRVVGTSAGSVISSILELGKLKSFAREVSFFARTPALVSALAPAGKISASQQRALDLFTAATDSEPETIRAIGFAALTAETPSAAKMRRSLHLILRTKKWPNDRLHITCVDAYTGERCVLTQKSGVSLPLAAAASSAVPGIFSPQPIGDRKCMDGGVSGTGTHLDLLAGAKRAVVLSLTADAIHPASGMTQSPSSFHDELEALRQSGTKVLQRSPREVDLTKLMDPKGVGAAMAQGREQAQADYESFQNF